MSELDVTLEDNRNRKMFQTLRDGIMLVATTFVGAMITAIAIGVHSMKIDQTVIATTVESVQGMVVELRMDLKNVPTRAEFDDRMTSFEKRLDRLEDAGD